MTPTRSRHGVILFAVSLSVLAFVDRACISMAAPAMRRDLHLGVVEMGYVFSAFALSYALFEIPGGWLATGWARRRSSSASSSGGLCSPPPRVGFAASARCW